MKKLFTLVAATMFAALSLISTKSYGSHAVGADVTYTYVGPNQYLVTIRFYRDCAGISAPLTHILDYSSSCFPGGSITLSQIAGSGQQIPPSPCLPAVTTSCNGGSGYGVEEYIYQGLVTLSGPCADWTFSFSECCRNSQITTITNPDSYNIYVATSLDNFNYPVNSSPVFTTIPVTQFCVGNQFFYNQGAIDPDGDSLVFSLVNALSAAGLALPYQPGYSPVQPIASSTPITIDSQTGTISFTPSMIQVGVIAVLCEEFRNGTKIGEVRRDIQMNVVGGCIGSAPVFAPPVDPFGNPAPAYTAQCGDTSIYIILDSPIQCGSVVTTDIRILTPTGALNPVMSVTPINCVNGVTDSILVTFFYPLTAGTTYAFTKVGFDNNTFLSECGVQMPEFDSIPFQVIDPGIFNTEVLNVGCSFDDVTVTFDYEIVCNTLTSTGSEFFLIDANNVTYPVTSTGNCPAGNGYSSTVTFNLGGAISPATPVYLIVQNGTDANTFTNRCNTFILPGDTLAVLTVLNNLIVDLGVDATLCDTDPLPVLDAGLSGATYTWTLNGNTLPDQTQTIIASASGTYGVSVSASASCFGVDSIQISIVNSPVVAFGSDISLCSTDPIPSLDAGNPGATYQWYESGILIATATNQVYQPTVAGNYSVIVSVGGSCTGTDDILITIDPSLIVALGNDQTICSTDPLPLLDAGVPNGTYQWFLNTSPVGTNTQTYQTMGAGTYSVSVTSLSGCTGTDDFILTIIQAPVVSLGADTTICSTDVLVLDAGNPGATYQWSLNGTAISLATNQTYTPTQTGNYSVLVNTGGQCQAGGSVNVTVIQQLSVTVSDVAICSDQPYPVLDAGISGVTYEWTLNGIVVGTSQTFQPTTPGSYVVTVSIGSCSGADIFAVAQVPVPVVNLTNTVICPGATFPVLDAGNAGATYLWSTNETTQTISPTAAGTYSVTVTNGALGLSCTASSTAILTNSAPVIVIVDDLATCDGGSQTFNAGNQGSTYLWSNGATTQDITVNAAATYTVTVTDANGCTGTDIATLTVNANPVVDAGADEAVCPGEELPTLTSSSTTGNIWTSSDGTQVGTGQTYDVTAYGSYQLEVIDNNGCKGTDVVVITEAPCEIEIPNVFTPNGDNMNEVFFIKNLDTNPNSKVLIFNRWGNLVYENSNYQNNWNGDGVPDGTYFYTVVLQNGKDYKGALEIISGKK